MAVSLSPPFLPSLNENIMVRVAIILQSGGNRQEGKENILRGGAERRRSWSSGIIVKQLNQLLQSLSSDVL